MAKFQKGQKRPPNAGRKKGTPNKKDEDIRKLISQGLISQGDRVFKELQSLEGKEYIECYEKLMKYILPQLKAIEHSGNEDKPVQPFQFIIQRQPDDSTE